MDKIKLVIYTPQGNVVDKMVSSVMLPGSIGTFTILINHSPIISSLDKGKLRYISKGETVEMKISEGFVEGNDNVVNVYIESIIK